MEDASRYPELFAELLKDPTWSVQDLKKLAGLNLLRVLGQVEQVLAWLWLFCCVCGPLCVLWVHGCCCLCLFLFVIVVSPVQSTYYGFGGGGLRMAVMFLWCLWSSVYAVDACLCVCLFLRVTVRVCCRLALTYSVSCLLSVDVCDCYCCVLMVDSGCYLFLSAIVCVCLWLLLLYACFVCGTYCCMSVFVCDFYCCMSVFVCCVHVLLLSLTA